jgi:putative transposase
MSKQHRVELARTLCATGTPVNKSQLAKLLGIARSSLYVHPQRPRLDKALAVCIESLQELDDTLGHRKLAILLKTGKNRVKRVMHTYGLAARRKRKTYVYPGKAAQVAPNMVRELEPDTQQHVVLRGYFRGALG